MLTEPKITDVNGELHVVALDEKRSLCHRVRRSEGSWTKWGRLPQEEFEFIDATGVMGELHVIGQTKEGFIKHNIRRENGSWQGWLDLPGDSLLDPFGDSD